MRKTDLISREELCEELNCINLPVGNETVDKIFSVIENMPSAQPEPCEDAVSREEVWSWLRQYGQDVLHGKYKFSLIYIWKNLMDLPSAQPENVRCKDCKWYELPSHKITENCVRWMKSNGILLRIKPNDYCSYAERRRGKETR